MPVGLVKRYTSSTQFNKWMRCLALKLEQVEPTHWYLGQIAKLIHDVRFFFGRGKRTEIKDSLLKFKMEEAKPKSKPAEKDYPRADNLTEEEKTRITRSLKLF